MSTANVALVRLYWNIGRIITQDIQKNKKRARYGDELLVNLGTHLTQEYGKGFSSRSLADMRRFFLCFEIQPPPVAESFGLAISPPLAAESKSTQALRKAPGRIRQRLQIDFDKHHHLGWTHYRILLSVQACYNHSLWERWLTCFRRELKQKSFACSFRFRVESFMCAK